MNSNNDLSIYDSENQAWAIAIILGGLVFRKFCHSHEIILFVECLDRVYSGPIMIEPW